MAVAGRRVGIQRRYGVAGLGPVLSRAPTLELVAQLQRSFNLRVRRLGGCPLRR